MTAAIETDYGGGRFRSRLEARWAAFFDLLGWRWTYEPLDAAGYIPDFVLHGDQPVLVEVKPHVIAEQYTQTSRHLERALDGQWEHDILVVGVDPVMAQVPDSWSPWGPNEYIGLHGEWQGHDDYHGPGWIWGAGRWITCLECGQPAFHHSFMWYCSRPCGHYDGDHLLGYIDPGDLTTLWNQAHLITRWDGRGGTARL